MPNAKGFGLTIDCTMTAANRPEMKNQESRFGIDWGVNPIAGCFEVTDSIYKVSLIRGTDEVPPFGHLCTAVLVLAVLKDIAQKTASQSTKSQCNCCC